MKHYSVRRVIVSAILLLSAGCSSTARPLTKVEQQDFKGGGAVPASAQAEISKHMAAFAASHNAKATPNVPAGVPSTGH